MNRREYTNFQQVILLSLTVRATEGIQAISDFRDGLANILPTIQVQTLSDHNYLHITMAAIVRWQARSGYPAVTRILNGKSLEKNMDDLEFCKAWVRLYLAVSEQCHDEKAHQQASELQKEFRFHFKEI